MTPRRYKAQRLVSAGAEVGEGPRWDSRTDRLIWVDIHGRAVHLTDPVTGTDERYPLDTMVGAAALRSGGGYLLAVVGGLAAWSLVPASTPRRNIQGAAGRSRAVDRRSAHSQAVRGGG